MLISFPAFVTDNDKLEATKSLQNGYGAYKSRDFNKAIKHLEQSYELLSYSKTAYYLSLCYCELDDPWRASGYANRTLSEQPRSSNTYRKEWKKTGQVVRRYRQHI